MPIIFDPQQIEGRKGSAYPEPFNKHVEGRIKHALTDALGLSQFGINLTTLKPGACSSLRHWHANEDEAIYVLTGELTLVDNAGAQILKPGSMAGFPAGDTNAHHLINKTNSPATYLEIGTRCDTEEANYPDHDLIAKKRDGLIEFFRKDGRRYE